ncbi:MAG: [FeFe] hydrogenase H-cluster maturation GTPase HydF [Candidatus Gastranaerophilales bacterium]|nr:[FeFe] hydrogenase H-cluster maturation GTPase HydF [Candidatus Gastranaerophilales bacterium]
MQNTPKGMRLHIGIFGKRNVGKSNILNALTHQNISIVSEVAGTTTDPVEKAMELLPLGPVLFVDTAGIDDEGKLGELRIKKTMQIFDRIDIALIVSGQTGWSSFEKELYEEFTKRKIPIIAVFNKVDLAAISDEKLTEVENLKVAIVHTSAKTGFGIDNLKQKLIENAPDEFITPPMIAADLIPSGEMAVLVVPIDLEAPKGRLILPQVQIIRDLLDNDSMVMVVKESDLKEALGRLNKPPHIVITDSQAFLKVSADVPENIKLTSFSILFARFKGDLEEFVRGALAIENLKPNDKILICESCTHHAIGDDIGTIKIPKWLNRYVGGKLEFVHYSGHDFPEDISGYKLIIHCGACMTNRREILSRIIKSKQAGVPVTNYGLSIAYALDIFGRALEPFPAAYQLYRELKMQAKK